MSLTAHCVVKNEDRYVGYAIRSVIDSVEKVLVFDTGSTDGTVEIIKQIADEYPDKVIFEEKGACDKIRHTELRQEMVDRTATGWFMVLDGDEVWTKRGLAECLEIINSGDSGIDCLIAPFHLCVGDVFHESKKKSFEFWGHKYNASPRVIRKSRGVHWQGDYNADSLVDEKGNAFVSQANSVLLKSHYWHMTHLPRSSSDGEDYSSNGLRSVKLRETYFFIGRKINESLPEVFGSNLERLSYYRSFWNFVRLFAKRLIKAK